MGKVTWYQAVVCVQCVYVQVGKGASTCLDLPPLLKRVFMGDILEFLLSIFQTCSYLSIYLPTYLPIYLSISISKSISISISLSIKLSIYQSINQSNNQSIYLSSYLSIYLSTYVSACLSIYVHLLTTAAAFLSFSSPRAAPDYCSLSPFCRCLQRMLQYPPEAATGILSSQLHDRTRRIRDITNI